MLVVTQHWKSPEKRCRICSMRGSSRCGSRTAIKYFFESWYKLSAKTSARLCRFGWGCAAKAWSTSSRGRFRSGSNGSTTTTRVPLLSSKCAVAAMPAACRTQSVPASGPTSRAAGYGVPSASPGMGDNNVLQWSTAG